MKAKLELEFDLPEEHCEIQKIIKAQELGSVLWNIDRMVLESWIEHGHCFDSADEALKAVREAMREELFDYGIVLEDLVGT